MTHVLILGMTESGKSTLAKKLCAGYKKEKIATIVLDPLCDPDWNADFQTNNIEEFLKCLWDSKSCAVFIDESGEAVGKYDTAMISTATKGRHWGHRIHYLSQRGQMISRTVRDQCSKLYLFTSSLDDCKIHANEWNKPELKDGYMLPQGHFYVVGRFTELKKHKLW
jgi:energy-coupling factor transporter ATP-binding protein EcfA2